LQKQNEGCFEDQQECALTCGCHSSIAGIMGTIGILAWPLGWAAASIGTSNLIDVAAGARTRNGHGRLQSSTHSCGGNYRRPDHHYGAHRADNLFSVR
jgi:hypothetical protein